MHFISCFEKRLGSIRLRLDQSSADRVPHQTRCLMDIQFLHQPHPMRFGRLHADASTDAVSLVDFLPQLAAAPAFPHR